MTTRVLILGGTFEARTLADALELDPSFEPLLSLAGATEQPEDGKSKRRVGGFGGAEGLAQALRGFDRLIDATHPYATRMSANAAAAALASGVPRLVFLRAAWPTMPDWQPAKTAAEAMAALPPGARVFWAAGRQAFATVAPRTDVDILLRQIDPPQNKPHYTVLLGKPSGDVGAEQALLKRHGITHVVSKNSGGTLGYAKIAAAEAMGAQVFMIDRPDTPPGPHAASLEAVMEWLNKARSTARTAP